MRALLPYAEVLGLWGRFMTVIAKKVQVPLHRTTSAQIENAVGVFNRMLVATPVAKRGGVVLDVNIERLSAGLRTLGIEAVSCSSMSQQVVQCGTLRKCAMLEDSGTTLAQREAQLLLERETALGQLTRLVDDFARFRGFGKVLSTNGDSKWNALQTAMGCSGGEDLIQRLGVERGKILGIPIHCVGSLDAQAAALRGATRMLDEANCLSLLIECASQYMRESPDVLEQALREGGFVGHENGVGPLLYRVKTDLPLPRLDTAPLERYRQREQVRSRFINPASIEREERRLTDMFAFLRQAFVDWFSGRARNFRPIDYRQAAELQERFLAAKTDFDPPAQGAPEADVLKAFLETVLPQSSGFPDPRYVSHMASNIPFVALMASWLMTILNQNVIEQSEASATVTFVEQQVISWIASLIGFDPQVAAGSAVSGGTIANITALLVARNKAFPDIMEKGFVGQSLPQPVVIVPRRVHYSIVKAAGIIGIGKENVIEIPVDEKDRMDIKQLEVVVRCVKADSTKRLIAIVGIAGTSETGAIDPLNEIADICQREGCWFHVDAAYGGAALTSSALRERFRGIARANSVTIDGHKWFYVPFQLGMVIFAKGMDLEWVKHTARYTIRDEEPDLGKFTIEGSRAANAVKLWVTMRALGTEGYGLIMEHCIETAEYLNMKVEFHPLLERLTETDLNFASFRYVPAELRQRLQNARSTAETHTIDEILNRLNIDLQLRFKQSGRGFFAYTELLVPQHEGLVVSIRAIVMNPFTNRKTIDEVVDAFVEEAETLWSERRVDVLSGLGG